MIGTIQRSKFNVQGFFDDFENFEHRTLNIELEAGR